MLTIRKRGFKIGVQGKRKVYTKGKGRKNMEEFEISIKSAPSGANVVVKGDLKQIVVEFAMLAASVSKKHRLAARLACCGRERGRRAL